MLEKIRHAVTGGVVLMLEAAGMILSFSGTALALFLGKLFAAAVLGAVTLGIFLRIAGRRRKPDAEPKPTPPWVYFVSAALSIVEVAVLTEATNLPVRFNQPEFAMYNWLLVVLALVAMFFLQVRFFRLLLGKRSASTEVQTYRD